MLNVTEKSIKLLIMSKKKMITALKCLSLQGFIARFGPSGSGC